MVQLSSLAWDEEEFGMKDSINKLLFGGLFNNNRKEELIYIHINMQLHIFAKQATEDRGEIDGSVVRLHH